MPRKPDEAVIKYFKKLGRKGGKVTSAAKTKAARINARKPRPGRRKKGKPK